MTVIFHDSVKKIPMPGHAREIPGFFWELWAWEVKFFWLLAIELELLLLFYLWEKAPALGRIKWFKSCVINLLATTRALQIVLGCEIHFGSEGRFLKKLPKRFWKRMRWIGNFLWGWALLAEGQLWTWIYKILPKGALARMALQHSGRVRLAGAIILAGAADKLGEAES